MNPLLTAGISRFLRNASRHLVRTRCRTLAGTLRRPRPKGERAALRDATTILLERARTFEGPTEGP